MNDKLLLPPLTALRSFEAFGRHLNLRDTADELCVTQSAISRQIKQLEDHLGVKLISRNGRNSQLTQIGSQYLSTIGQSFNQIAQQTQLLFPSHKNQSLKTHVKLGISPVMAEYWLLPRLTKLKDHLPNIDLEIYINRGVNNDTPLSHVDLELFHGPLNNDEYLCEKLFQIIDFPVCSPTLAAPKEAITTLDDMLQHQLIHEVSPHWWPAWLKAVGFQGKSANHGPLIDDEVLPIKLALQGQGIAMGDYLSTYQYLKTGQLIRPVKEFLLTEEWLCLLLKPHNQNKAYITDLCIWIRAQMDDFKKDVKAMDN